MPEGLEAEIWRRACEPLVGRTIVDAVVDERVAPFGFADIVRGATISGVGRTGKVVLLDVEDVDAERIGLHFGMTGRLVVDGAAPIDRLTYASGRDDSAWDRVRLFTQASPGTDSRIPALRLNDPRRLGKVTLDPDLSTLGVDVFALRAPDLHRALRGRRTAVKSALLDQHVVAGLGNLLSDEVLWWSGISPLRRADSLDDQEIAGLASAIRRRLPIMLRRGGSTMGTLSPDVRSACPPCERDGVPLQRGSVGGRTTIWCPDHQR
ncbi:MAG: DNA-formamidopyrimidine glycosylase family protein [Ilumatobacteraceae bacterium]